MRTASVLLAGLSLCLAEAHQQPILGASINPLDEKFGQYVHSILDHFHVPAISIAVVKGDEVYAEGYGTAVFPNVSAKAETLYFVGSTTKSFTAAALTLLMDDLKNSSVSFDWKTPVSSLIRDDFVLEDEYITTHATLEDLASHRTGFPRHDLSYGSKGHRSVRDTVRNMRNLPLTAGFREKFQYCNYMWATLAYVAENLAGKPLQDFLRSRVWNPLGMNSTYWTLEEAQLAEKAEGKELARGYTWDDASEEYYADPYLDIGPLAGAGCMISSVLDYAKYLEMMLRRSTPLSPEAHTQLRRARTLMDEDIEAPFSGVSTYTLGWWTIPYRGVNMFAHSGGLFGFGAYMAYIPELDFAVAMLGNTAGTSNNIEEVLLFALVDSILGTPKPRNYDWVKHFDERLRTAAVARNESRRTAFGTSIPKSPLPASLPLSSYEGSYWSESYKLITLNISNANSRIPQLNATHVLRADLTDRVWPGYLELEHVSGEYFLAWTSNRKGASGNEIEVVSEAVAAEFRIGADGRPVELGIALESYMKGEKIWFQRV